MQSKTFSGLINIKVKQLLKESLLHKLVINRRVAKARRFLQYGDIYPESLDSIIEDYRFSISRDYRSIMQVINLEESIRYSTGLDGAFVETGVFTGGASAYALKAMMRLGVTRDYYGFDSFEGMPTPSTEDGKHAISWAGTNPRDVNRADFAACLKYLCSTGYPTDQIRLTKGWFNETLPATKKSINSIAILRLDGDFYASTKVALEQLYDLVVDRGVVIIDDYGTFEGCKKAVDEFLRLRGSNPPIHYVDKGIRFFVKG